MSAVTFSFYDLLFFFFCLQLRGAKAFTEQIVRNEAFLPYSLVVI